MSTRANTQFLDVEELATELVDELKALKTETVSYSTAHNELRETSAAIIRFTEELTGLVERAGSTIDALREIGTPKLLAEQQALANQLTSQSSQFNEILLATKTSSETISKDIQSTARSQDQRIATLSSHLDAELSELRNSVTAIGTNVESAQLETSGLLERTQENLAQRIQGIEAQLNSHQSSIDSRIASLQSRMLMSTGIIVASLVLVAILVVIM